MYREVRSWTDDRMKHAPQFIALASALALLCSAGCTTVSPEFRADHANAFREELAARTAHTLPEDSTLGLDECLEIALKHNLTAKAAQVDAKMARLEKNIAFAAFFPEATLSGSITTWEHQPASTLFGLIAMPVHDKTLRDISLQVQTPVTVPSTWFLYSMRRHGAEIGDLVVDYTRQMIALRVTVLYYECLARAEAEKTLASQLESAQTLDREISELYLEGMVPHWEAEQAEAAVLARLAALHEAQRALRQRKADLLCAMGLAPLATVTLAANMPLNRPPGNLAELAFQALINHPQLHIADRRVVIAKEQTRIAIAEFLPKLMGFTTFTSTSESSTKYPEAWLAGVSAVLTVFNGFANVQEYRAAHQNEQKALLAREEFCLSLLAQVLAAYLNEQTAREYLEAAAQALTAAEARLSEVEARSDEGMVLASECLKAVAERDDAQMQLARARYRHQVSVAILLNAVGSSYTGN